MVASGRADMRQNRKRLLVLVCVAVVLGGTAVFRFTRSDERRLVQQLRSGGKEGRIEAIHGLEKVGSSGAADAIASVIGDSDTQAACHAVIALGRMPTQHLQSIEAAARDSRPEVRRAAATAMGHLGDRADPGKLLVMLGNKTEDNGVRAAAARSLGRLNVFEAMPALIEALDDASPAVRARANTAIMRIMEINLRFRANDPPKKRQAAIARIRNLYPKMAKKHAYIKRCRAERRKSK